MRSFTLMLDVQVIVEDEHERGRQSVQNLADAACTEPNKSTHERQVMAE